MFRNAELISSDLLRSSRDLTATLEGPMEREHKMSVCAHVHVNIVNNIQLLCFSIQTNFCDSRQLLVPEHDCFHQLSCQQLPPASSKLVSHAPQCRSSFSATL